MKTTLLPIAGSAIVDVEPFEDHRGVFCRWFCCDELSELMGSRRIVNLNYSKTVKCGTVRGMHFQHAPKAEMKLIRCLGGSVFDVMVDLRKGSPTFLKWHSVILSAETMNMVVIPEGVAHGFQTLETDAEMLYLHTAFYAGDCDAGVRYDDPRIGIPWPLPVSDLSEKDAAFPLLETDFRGLSL